jgi:YD repeat-containing protein
MRLGNSLDDNSLSATETSGTDYGATITWGDNSTPTSGTVSRNSDGSFSVYGSHAYAGAGSYAVSVTVTDEGGQSTTFTTTATVSGAWTVTGTALAQRSDDPDRAFLMPLGEANVDLNQGAVRLSQALDFDLSPGNGVGGSPALVYNGAVVNVRPVIQLTVQSNPSGPMATTAQVAWSFNGVAQPTQTFSTSGLTPGAAFTLGLQVGSPVAVSGYYGWSATLTLTFPDNSTQTASASGNAYVVARDGSPYGAGWWIDGIPQLVSGASGVLFISGQGDARFFTGNGGGPQTYGSPAEDFGTLVQNPGGTFTYTTKHQTRYNFNASGQLTSVVDRDGVTLLYTYDGQGRLYQVAAPDGSTTTLNYSGGLLGSISEPGGRTVGLTHSGTDLTGIGDVDGTTRGLGYDGQHHVTSDQWAPLSASFGYDPVTGLLNNVNRGLGTTYAISSAAAQDLTNTRAGPAWASVTDGNSHTTKYLLDGRGRLLERVAADGSSTKQYARNAAGDVVLSLVPPPVMDASL